MAAIESVVPITLPADPIALVQAARQAYVDYIGIPKFADAAARDLYFTNPLTPLRAGQFAYLIDIDELQRYDGTALTWSISGTEPEVFAVPDAVTTPPLASTTVSQFIVDTGTPITGSYMSNEIYVGSSDPRVDRPSTTVWFDTSVDPPTLKFWNTATAPPAWDASISEGYLSLSGGTMASNAVIAFPNEADKTKLTLYGSTTQGFGFGITSGTMNVFASGTVKFQQHSITGPVWAYIDATCGGGRVLTDKTGVTRQTFCGGSVAGPYSQTKLTINVPVAGRYLVQWGANYKPMSGADWWSVPFYVDNAQADISTSWLPDAHAYGGTRVFERDFTAGNHTFGISGQVVGDDHDTLTVVLLPTT